MPSTSQQTGSRRQFAAAMTATAAAAAWTASPAAAAMPEQEPEQTGDNQGLRFCLNTSTIRGQKLTLPQQIDVAAQAGYDAIEPWIGDLRKYQEGGGSWEDLRKRIADAGITVESGIGFARWIVDDDSTRKAALEEAKRDMNMLAEIGGKRIAAPPMGAQKQRIDSLPKIAERYGDLLRVSDQTGVVAQLELWGFSQTLSRLGEVAYVAAECGHANACVLPDFYHIYKGGSDFAGLNLIEASRMHVFHINDYPSIDRKKIGDADRVFPGDGICPLGQLVPQLIRNGFKGYFSLELFNRDLWKLDALSVAKQGLQKCREACGQA
ncbi:MAG: sugar phosphate isomerase/epimerase family protein [Planctomycetota bacterium]